MPITVKKCCVSPPTLSRNHLHSDSDQIKNFKDPLGIRFSKIANEPIVNQEKKKKKSKPWKNGKTTYSRERSTSETGIM